MDENDIFDLVVCVGEAMLRSGGEISRTTETMQRIAAAYKVQNFSAFIIANGIFASAVTNGNARSAVIKYVPLAPIHLCRVEAINDLSRKIAGGCCTPQQAAQRLGQIREMTVSGKRVQLLAAGLGCACFCYLFGGSAADSSVAFFAGLLLYVFLLFAVPRASISPIMSNLLGSAMVTVFCWSMLQLGWGGNMDKMIIGGIIPLVPGVPFVNAIRNFLESDYLAGVVRLVDTVLVAVCIAGGVGLTMQAIQFLSAGGLL